MSRRLQVTLKDENYQLVEKLSEKLGVTKSTIVTLAIQDFNKKQSEKNEEE
jgi:predicted DNA-binding protein